MELKHTVSLMLSSDYKERFIAEYLQLKIRRDKLLAMCEKWDNGKLEFTPTCPREFYDDQLKSMNDYLIILQKRGTAEGIDLEGKDFEATINHRTDYIPRIKSFRKLGDELVQSVKELQPSHEVNNATDKFLEGIMWLGMELKRVGNENPYPNSKDAGTGNIVDKTADGMKM